MSEAANKRPSQEPVFIYPSTCDGRRWLLTLMCLFTSGNTTDATFIIASLLAMSIRETNVSLFFV